MTPRASQLAVGLRAVHVSGLSFRGVLAGRVLVTGHNRVRFGSVGVLDVLEVESKKSLADLQAGDMLSYGVLLLQVCRCFSYAGLRMT